MMEKALEKIIEAKENINMGYNEWAISCLDEAIAELEETLQQSKNCEGCKYEHEDAYSLPCAGCVRNCDRDYYEPKEQ